MLGSLTTPIGKIFQPLLDAVGSILAFFFSIIPNYPIDVALLTVVIMALLTPITVKSTKSMAALQALSPEMKKLQQKYKGAENRSLLNEEMMKLYKEHNVSPASGCLPMLLQLPAFFILYSVVRGITNTVTHPAYTTTVDGLKVHHPQTVQAVPRYIPIGSKMHADIVAAHGQLVSFGMDFANKLLGHHSSLFAAIPFLLLALASVALQYVQMARLNARNPSATQANPQAAALQKYMPLIFGFIYINVAAILNVYFIISSVIRVLTQEVLFRRGIVGGPPPVPTTTAPVKATPGERTERSLPRATSSSKAAPTKAGAGKTNSTSRSADRTGPAAPTNGKATKATGTGSKSIADRESTARARNSPTGSRGSTVSNQRAAKGAAGSTPQSNGTNAAPARGRPPPANRPSSGRRAPNRAGGSKQSAEPDTQTGKTTGKEHPRSKAKRERKAR
ncbi:MAG: YidC/Oxa1 family membrane protein insertase [Acidimicrobiales bacterium]